MNNHDINLHENESKNDNNTNNNNNDVNNTNSTKQTLSQVKDLLHFNNENIIIEETTSINKDIPLYQGNSNTSNKNTSNNKLNQNDYEIHFSNDNKNNNNYTQSKEEEPHKHENSYNNNNSYTHSEENEQHKQEYDYNTNKEQCVLDNDVFNENSNDNYISPSIKEHSNIIEQPETINTQLFSNANNYDNNKNSQSILFNKENQVDNKDEVVSQTEGSLNYNHINSCNKNNDNISSNESPQFEISNGTTSNDFQISNGNEKMTIHDHKLLYTTSNNNQVTTLVNIMSHLTNNNNNINLNKPSNSSLNNPNQQISSNNITLNGEEHNNQALNNTNMPIETPLVASSLNNNYINNDTIHPSTTNIEPSLNHKTLEQHNDHHLISSSHIENNVSNVNNNSNQNTNSTPNSENNRYITSNGDKDNNIISNPINTDSSSDIYGLPLQIRSLNNNTTTNNLKQYTKHQTITNSAMKSRIYRDLSNHNSYSIDNQSIPITNTNNENGIAQPHKHNSSTINIPSETTTVNNDITNNNNNIITSKQSSLLRPNIIRKLEKKNEIIQKQKQKQNYSVGGISDNTNNISSPEKPVMLLPHSIKNIKVKDENTQVNNTNNILTNNENNNNDDINNINFPLKKRNSIKRINIKNNDKNLNMPFTPSTVTHSHLNPQPSQPSATHNLQIKPSPYLPPSQLPSENDVPLTTNDLVTSPQTQQHTNTTNPQQQTMKFAIVKGSPTSSTNNDPLNDNNMNTNNNNNNSISSEEDDDNDNNDNEDHEQCTNVKTKVIQHKHSSNSKRIPLTPHDNDIESSDDDESAEEKVIAFDDDKITKTRKVKEKAKQHHFKQKPNSNTNIFQEQINNADSLMLEQPTSISHHPNSKNHHHRHKSNPNNNTSSTPSQSMITSSNAMKHIHKIDTSTSAKKFEFEPKELDDNMITSINNSKQQQQQQPSHMLSSSVIGKTDPFTYHDDNVNVNNNNNNNNQLRLDDLQTENNKHNVDDNAKSNNNNNNKKHPKVFKVKTKEELVKLLKETNELEDSDTSVYYYIEENGDNLTDIQEEEDDLLDSQSNRNRNSQIVKVKNRKVISVSMNAGSKYGYIDNNTTNTINNDNSNVINIQKNVSDNEMNNSLSEILKNQNEHYIDELTQENEMNTSNNGALNKDNLDNNNNECNNDNDDINESNELSFNSKTLPQFYNRKIGNATIERDHDGNIIGGIGLVNDGDNNVISPLTTTGFVKMKSHKLFGTANKNKQTQPTFISNNAHTTIKKVKSKKTNAKGNSGVNNNVINTHTPIPKTVSQVRNVNYNKFVQANTITSSPSKKRGESPMINANTNWNKQFNKQKSIQSTGSGGNANTNNIKGVVAINKNKNLNSTSGNDINKQYPYNIKPKQPGGGVISQIKQQHKTQTPINPSSTPPQNLNNSFNNTSPAETLQTPLTQQDNHYFHTQTAFHSKQPRYTPTPSSSHSKPPKFNQTQVNTINYLNKQIPSAHSSNYKTPSFKNAVSPSSSNSKPLKQNNLSKELTRAARKQQKEDELSYMLLKQKYAEYIQEQASKGKNVNITSEEQEKDETFLQELAVGDIKANTINNKGNSNIRDINNMNVSNVMKEFIIQSVENFKLNQVKERITYQMGNKADNSNSIVPTRSNLFGLIQLDYEDENENKERSNMLEPIELDKSWISILRSSFISK